MVLQKSFYLLLFIVVMFVGCGGGSSTPITTDTTVTNTTTDTNTTTVTVSGKATYDSVPFNSGGTTGLDYNNITQKPIRGAIVEVVDSLGNLLGTTSTDSLGNYSLTVTGTDVKVRIYAKLYKAVASGQSSWDFQVKDNTNGNALYVMEGALASLGTASTQTRNLNAASGWGGTSYTSTRTAAPFAILDVVYSAINKITTAQNNAVFPPLNIYWSKNNISSTTKNVAVGQIITSHYSDADNAFYILGAENSDTDEYDTAIVAHEWSHYYESKFSRSDSIGGHHSPGDMKDIRLAFGEGFATAFGCMILDTNLYMDSVGSQQASSSMTDVEAGGSRRNPGWYSEASVFSILYDLYDSNSDTGDNLSLGFTPIHNLFIGAQKNTAAFTSIFTFITALKAENPGNDAAIDAITSNESIASITDIYGTGRTNRQVENANPLYANLTVGGSVTINPDYSATSVYLNNKLGIYNFITFTIPSSGTYTITASSGTGTNLDFYAYAAGSKSVAITSSGTGSSISGTATLAAGTYRMYIVDYNLQSGETFTVSLN